MFLRLAQVLSEIAFPYLLSLCIDQTAAQTSALFETLKKFFALALIEFMVLITVNYIQPLLTKLQNTIGL